ncbi:chromosomal replication initiator protein DnaA [Metamycoplasma spumans]|uniref:chromosomal replication initiator protein DnaA n=1 Tax=Metamycoplasma spumans TaxID=92406 RepID=UPI0034DD9855
MKTILEKPASLKLINTSFQNELKNNAVDQMTYNSFLSTIYIIEELNDTVFIFAPEPIMHYVKTTQSSNIEKVIKNIYDRPMNIIFITDEAEIKRLGQQKSEIKKPQVDNLKHDLTFENYVKGKFNHVVLKAAKTICESENVIYSPLFIYSPSGLGKTHLLNAIGNELALKNKKSLYINPDLLTTRLVEQLRNKNQAEINRIVEELTSYDCLMFDDVQQYGNRDSTLNVLFNIINRMITSGKQIIIACDKKPNDLGGFEERFITRFQAGLVVEITSPDVNDVISILKFKLVENNINPELWEDESLRFIARNFGSSIRSIEGAINRVKLFSEDDDFFTYDITTIQTIFKNITQIKDNITPERIIDAVSKYYQIDRKKITSTCRTEDIVIARRISIYLIRNNFNYTLVDIGKMLGNQSHSTILVSLKWIDKNIQTNSTLKIAIEKIQENLRKII